MLRTFLFVLLLGKIEMSEEFEHALVLAHHHRVEVPYPIGTCYVD